MKMKRVTLLCSLTCALFLVVTPLMVSSGFAISIEKGAMNGVSYMTGGVGIEERNAMEDLEKQYNLKVVLATSSGSYLSGLKVVIRNDAGDKVLEILSNGPWLYADLPPGAYKVTATGNDQKPKVRQVKCGQTLVTVLFHWQR